MNSIPKMPAPARNPIKWQLLEMAPSTGDYSTLVVKTTHETDRHFAAQYAFAAERLGNTFDSKSEDDMILLPFLTLYRQAYELALKSWLADLARWRRKCIDSSNPAFNPTAVQERIRKNHGHNFHKLLTEIREHYDALGLGEPFPQDLADLINAWHQTDKPGTSFRYASVNQPTEITRINFPALAEMLHVGIHQLWAVEDWVDYCMDAIPES
ncbi:hypothetical protein [Pseudarthrobacter oxydans]|uniref:hypothetical protein n=1 Tax=Pseudarthrobacter oxydans TaxID=1671 RepID=UPI00380B55C3